MQAIGVAECRGLCCASAKSMHARPASDKFLLGMTHDATAFPGSLQCCKVLQAPIRTKDFHLSSKDIGALPTRHFAPGVYRHRGEGCIHSGAACCVRLHHDLGDTQQNWLKDRLLTENNTFTLSGIVVKVSVWWLRNRLEDGPSQNNNWER